MAAVKSSMSWVKTNTNVVPRHPLLLRKQAKIYTMFSELLLECLEWIIFGLPIRSAHWKMLVKSRDVTDALSLEASNGRISVKFLSRRPRQCGECGSLRLWLTTHQPLVNMSFWKAQPSKNVSVALHVLLIYKHHEKTSAAAKWSNTWVNTHPWSPRVSQTFVVAKQVLELSNIIPKSIMAEAVLSLHHYKMCQDQWCISLGISKAVVCWTWQKTSSKLRGN